MDQTVQIGRSVLRTCASKALRLCGAFYFLTFAGCSTFQRRFIYFPPVFSEETVEKYARVEKLERWHSATGKPIGWKRMSPVQPARGQVLIMHGNGGTAVQCGYFADPIQSAAPVDVFIVEYPGYADRPGKPTERTLYQSSEEAFLTLATNRPVYLVGESLGTGVASYLAGKHPEKTAGVVLLAPYTSVTDVAQSHVRIFPVRWILVDRFPAEHYLREYCGPTAMLVAGGDWIVPARFGVRLYEGYRGPKKLWQFPQGNHGTVMQQPPEVWSEIFAFLTSNPPG